MKLTPREKQITKLLTRLRRTKSRIEKDADAVADMLDEIRSWGDVAADLAWALDDVEGRLEELANFSNSEIGAETGPENSREEVVGISTRGKSANSGNSGFSGGSPERVVPAFIGRASLQAEGEVA